MSKKNKLAKIEKKKREELRAAAPEPSKAKVSAPPSRSDTPATETRADAKPKLSKMSAKAYVDDQVVAEAELMAAFA